jgi:hydroxymethylbilane synthase
LTPAATPLRLGTRGSALALIQADLVRHAYIARFPDREVEIVVLKTTGDRQKAKPLAEFSGQGVFVKEIENAVLAGEVDAAVHSAKDLAIDDREGLEVSAFLERGAPHDVLVRREPSKLWEPQQPGEGFRIATGSPRRQAQLANAWPGVSFTGIRGNVDTRLKKLAAGEADALVLAAVGLRRLQLSPPGEEPLPLTLCVPAPGQGAIAVQSRVDDQVTTDLHWLNHMPTALAVQCERDLALAVGAGCAVPLGAYVEFRAGDARLLAALQDGERLVRVEVHAPATSPADVVGGALSEFRDRGVKLGEKRG